MFGYIKPYAMELRMKEHLLYKSIYCGLCKTMKKYCGKASTLTLSYDFVFLALFRSALFGEKFEIKTVRCFFKKKKVCVSSGSLQFCAASSAILNYYKVLDNINDNRGFSRLLAYLYLPFAKRGRKKAIKNFAQFDLNALDDEINFALTELNKLEKSYTGGANSLSDAFGRLLGVITSFGVKDEKLHTTAENFGRYIGRWIYLADAADDFQKDQKSGAFNPLIGENGTVFSGEILLASMHFEQENAQKTLDCMSFLYDDIKNLLYNTVTYGMDRQLEKILNNNTKTTKKGDLNV